MLTVVSPSGLKEWRISKLEHPDPSQEAPYGIQADLIFPSADDVRKAFGEEGEQSCHEKNEDVSYTVSNDLYALIVGKEVVSLPLCLRV